MVAAPDRAIASFPVWLGGLLGLAVLAIWLWVGTLDKRIPPDVVLVVIDTLRADHLDSYGHTANSGPVISGLAERGTLYERVVAPSSWTKTSMASIWTGRNAMRHGVLREESPQTQ